MQNFTIEPLNPSHLAAIRELQMAYSAVYPAAPIIPGEVYLSPAYEDGKNLFSAIDESGNSWDMRRSIPF